jgi:hypothetical protein
VVRLIIPGEEEAIETSEIEDPTRSEDLVLDLLCVGEPGRFRIIADEFSYDCLGSRMRRRARDNFPVIAHLILDRCDVMPNRGAARFHLGHPEWFSYPSWNAFEEETRWLMWKTAWLSTRALRAEAAESSVSARRRRR